MDLTDRPAAVVVDFAAFRAQREVRRPTEGIPQDDGPRWGGPPPNARPEPLSPRQLDHRRRMLEYLLTERWRR